MGGFVEIQLISFLVSAQDVGELHVPETESQFPLNRRAGGPQSGSGRIGEEKNVMSLSHVGHWALKC